VWGRMIYAATASANHRIPAFELTKKMRRKTGAGNETRTRDPDLGKVVLYQLSYSRNGIP
jgi:hypothetical protein